MRRGKWSRCWKSWEDKVSGFKVSGFKVSGFKVSGFQFPNRRFCRLDPMAVETGNWFGNLKLETRNLDSEVVCAEGWKA